MAKTTSPLLPSTAALLERLGARLRLARLRRGLTARQVAERAGMAPLTLRNLERGRPGVTMGAYLAVMQVLGVEQEVDRLVESDPVGRQLQDAALPARGRARSRPTPAAGAESRHEAMQRRAVEPEHQRRRGAGETDGQWLRNSGFTSAEALAGLIKPPPAPKKKR